MIAFQHGPLAVFQSALYQTNSAVIEGNEFVLVTDPAWLPHEVDAIADYVQSVRAGRPLYLLLTHADYDHILGAGAFPNAIVIASRAFADCPDKMQAAARARAWDSEYYVRRPYAVDYPNVDIAAEDGQSLVLGSSRLMFHAAPGHTADGLVTLVEPHRVCIAGDYLSDLEFPLLQDSAAYERTLLRLDVLCQSRVIHTLVPGHGTPATDRDEVRRRLHTSFDYIAMLRALLASGDDAALNALPATYPFPDGLRAFHAANIALLRAEAGENVG